MNIENLLKRCIKGKFKITQGLIVSFLITGTLAFGIDITEDFTNENNIADGMNISIDNLQIENKGVVYNIYQNNSTGESLKGNAVLANNKNLERLNNEGSINSNIKVTASEDVNLRESANVINLYDANINNFLNTGEVVAKGEVKTDKTTKISYINNAISIVKGSANNIRNRAKIIALSKFESEYIGEVIGAGNGGVVTDGSINLVDNTGNIEAKSIVKNAVVSTSGNGLNSSMDGNINSLSNIGKISGELTQNSTLDKISLVASGNGASINNANTQVFNSGVLSGYVETASDNEEKALLNSGAGLEVANGMNLLRNKGVIKGSTSAVVVGDGNLITGESINYGLMAGREIYSKGVETIKGTSSTTVQSNLERYDSVAEENKGVYVKLKSEVGIDGETTGNVISDANGMPIIDSIENGVGGAIDGLQIVNANRYDINGTFTDETSLARDSYMKSSELTENTNIILNAAGIEKGALIVDKNLAVSDSIINAYKTAVHINAGNEFVANNLIVNGGGLKGEHALISGEDGGVALQILGESYINGNIALGSGDNIITVENTATLNGHISGLKGNDTLNLGLNTISKNTNGLSIFNNINGIETINTNGLVTLYEGAKITGNKEIIVNNGELLIRVNPNETLNGEIIGHALYEGGGTIKSNNGTIVMGVNGLKDGATIALGQSSLDSGIDNNWWEPTDKLVTNSLLYDAKLNENGNIDITLFEAIPLDPPIVKPEPPVEPEIPEPELPEPEIPEPELPEPPVEPEIPEPPVEPEAPEPEKPEVPKPGPQISGVLYEKLNEIYKGVVSAKEVDKLANTTLLEDKTRDEALEGLLDILNQIYINNPYGYVLKASKDSLKLYEDSIGTSREIPKYGHVLVEGNIIASGVRDESNFEGKDYYSFDKGKDSFKTTSVTSGGLATLEYGIKNNSTLGLAFGGSKQNIKFNGKSNIKGDNLYVGMFTRTDFNNFRVLGGVGYQYSKFDIERGVSNSYDSYLTKGQLDTHSLNAYLEGKYIYRVDESLTLEPKVKGSYYYSYQEGVREKYSSNNLSLGVDNTTNFTGDVEIGVDIVKNININQGKLSNIFSLSAIKTIGGRENILNGYIVGENARSTNFDIKGTELLDISAEAGYSIEYKIQNGITYNAGLSLEFGENYTRNLNAKLGIGYTF